MDKDLRDDMLKLVKYRILFVKREYETAFHEHEDVIEDNLDGGALTAWKIAEFMQHLAKRGEIIPPKWGDTYPPKDCQIKPEHGHSGYEHSGDEHSRGRRFYAFPEPDKKYLRVSYEILERYPRERFKYEEQQIKILEEMRDRLPKQPE